MPVDQQNSLVKKYCAVCHTDATRNGGLTLQHFDAATAAPSLMTMLVSKRGTGAMGAAGLPGPGRVTEDALKQALAAQAKDARFWTVQSAPDPATNAAVLTASILRELPSPAEQGKPFLYRLVITCNTATAEGHLQLAWAPRPRTGTLSILVDGKVARDYLVEGHEKMGNGNPITTGPAAFTFPPALGLPTTTLRASGLFPGETVEFPVSELPETTRESLGACFRR